MGDRPAPKNMEGGTLLPCCGKLNARQKTTGFYRDGLCRTDAADRVAHIVCAEMTREFLDYTKAQGNDLSADAGAHFRGLVPRDRWCLCIERWLEARRAGQGLRQDAGKQSDRFTQGEYGQLAAATFSRVTDRSHGHVEALEPT